MAAEEEGNDMDSLFEGMVLFSPQQEPPSSSLPEINHHQPSSSNSNVAVSSSPSAQDQSQSEPLDENLFSDLTLITPTHDSDPPPSQSSPLLQNPSTISRQLSSSTRKKKRASGLRIGYGRQSSSIDEHAFAAAIPLDRTTNPVDSVPQDNSSNAHDTIIETPISSRSSTSLEEEEEEEEELVVVDDVDGSNKNKDDASSHSSLIDLRFEEIKSLVAKKLKHVQEFVTSVSLQRKESLRKRRRASENLNKAAAEYNMLEKELEEACKVEDFEKAERISESLSFAERERESMAVTLRDAEAECSAVEEKMHAALEMQTQAEEECASLLHHFAMDAANDADLVIYNAEAVSSKEFSEWQTSSEQLDFKMLELQIESHLINDVKSCFESSKNTLAEADLKERDHLCNKKEVLTEELENLLLLVKQKQAEIAENDYNIEIVEKTIANIFTGVQDVQSRIDMKLRDLESGLSWIKEENEALVRRRKEIDDFFAQEQARGSEIKELSKSAGEEGDAYHEAVRLRKRLMELVLKSSENKQMLSMSEEKLSQDLLTLKQEVSAARASIQEISSNKTAIQQKLDSYTQRLLFIEKRVLELEAEKKVAAAARNFREAARIATEAKALSVEKDELLSNREAAVSEIRELEAEVDRTVKRLEETEMQILSKEKELAVARYKRLVLTARTASAERSAALELGDLEEADVLLVEAEAAIAEARSLRPVYNIDDEEEDLSSLQEKFVSLELIAKLGGKQLEDLASAAHVLPPSEQQ